MKAKPSEDCEEGCEHPAGLPRITAPASRMHHMAIALSISLGLNLAREAEGGEAVRGLDTFSTLCARVFHVNL